MKRCSINSYYTSCRLAVLLFSVVFTLPAEDLKGKAPAQKDKDNLPEVEPGNENNSFVEANLYRADLPGFVLHGDVEVTLLDSKSKRKTGTDTLHFHYTQGLKMVGMEKLTEAFGNKRFKVEKKGEDTYLLTSNYNNANNGTLILEVMISGGSQEISGRLALTKPGAKQEVKLFKGTYVYKGDK